MMKKIVLIFPLIFVIGCLNVEGNKTSRGFINLAKPPVEDAPPTPTVVRPDGVTLSNTFCACRNGQPDIIADCFSFCSGKTHTTPILYLDTSLSADITLNAEIFGGTTVSLHEWCKELDSEPNAKCVLEYESEDGPASIPLEIETLPGSNRLTADIANLTPGKTYVLGLSIPGYDHYSTNKIQLRRKTSLELAPFTGYLKQEDVSGYSCLQRSGYDNGITFNYTQANRLSYFFVSTSEPTPVVGDNYLICHDVTHSTVDALGVPRYLQREQEFLLWNKSDSRFYDLNATGSPMDINDLIKTEVENLGGTVANNMLNLFYAFRWPNGPTPSGSTAPTPIMGYAMYPFINTTDGSTFCPTQINYSGTNPLFRAIGMYLGTNTEALFLAERNPTNINVYNTNGQVTGTQAAPPDYLLLRQSQLEEIWFYLNSGIPTVPTQALATTRTIYFYWPPATDVPGSDPLIRRADQVAYRIVHPSDLGSSQGIPSTTFTPADKRIGCIPELGTP